MDWLRHSTQGVQMSRTSRAVVAHPLTPTGRSTVRFPAQPQPGVPAHSGAKPCGTTRTLVREIDSRPRHHFPTSLGSTVVTRFSATTDALTPTGPVRRPPWFPDSRHQNFRPFPLQPSAVLRQPRPLPRRWQHYFVRGSRRFARWLAKTADRIEFTLSQCVETLLRTGRSLPVALHPGVSPRCSYVQLLALQCRPSQGLAPCCSSAPERALGQSGGKSASVR